MNDARQDSRRKGVLYKLLYGFFCCVFPFLKPITIKESTMSMFPIMIIAGAFMLISVVVGIYGVRKYN